MPVSFRLTTIFLPRLKLAIVGQRYVEITHAIEAHRSGQHVRRRAYPLCAARRAHAAARTRRSRWTAPPPRTRKAPPPHGRFRTAAFHDLLGTTGHRQN